MVALLYVMLLVGMVAQRLRLRRAAGRLQPTSRLVQVVQGAAVVTMVLNVVALWKQEARDPPRTDRDRRAPGLPRGLAALRARRPRRAACWSRSGSAPPAFSMQDILLEPYGGQILQPDGRRDDAR